MAEKYVRGQLLIFRVTPKDENELSVQPSTVKVYINYIHADGIRSSDGPFDMDQTTDGIYEYEFDSKVAKAGDASAHVRTTGPAGGADIKFKIIAEAANPNP